MTSEKRPVEIPVLAMPIAEARSIGLSENAFREVPPHVRSVKAGRQRGVAVTELERWLFLNGRFADEEE